MDIPVKSIKQFESEFLIYLNEQQPGIGASIKDSKELTDETAKKLEAAIIAFKAQFTTSIDQKSIV
jgi:F-type H+-transporting ATPase subunit alpha